MIKSIIAIILYFYISGCFGNMQPSVCPYTNEPEKYIMINGVDATQESFQQIADLFGKAKEIAVGAGFIISALNLKPMDAALLLRQYLSLSERFDVPDIVRLDGEQWWNNRPDIWNWWDKNKPGYNPEKRKNVEWTTWTSDSAVKIGWRNWGRQLRVLPMTNLMSLTYRKVGGNKKTPLPYKDW